MTFTRDLKATGVSVEIRAGSNLSSWDIIDPEGPNRVGLSTVGPLQTLTIRDNASMSGANSRFMLVSAVEL